MIPQGSSRSIAAIGVAIIATIIALGGIEIYSDHERAIKEPPIIDRIISALLV